jgi:predicted acylesterase/phospholipase RssA
MITGPGHQEVIELIRNRIGGGRGIAPERRLALVVEGGAMRGTYTSGALLGFHLLGATGIFDCTYATSAGAINAAHFLSGVGHLKAATYYRALADGRFFNPRRLSKLVDIDFLFDVVLRMEIPLEIDRLVVSQSPLKVAVLNCINGSGEMKDIVWDAPYAWDTLKAAVAMPVVYNRKVHLDEGLYVDGGMAIPYPLNAAIDDGMTDVVVLLSQNPLLPVRSRGLSQYLLWWVFFARGKPALTRVFNDWRTTINNLNEMVCGNSPSLGSVRILAIAPTQPNVRSSTMDGTLLRNGCIEMASEVLSVFGASKDLVKNLIQQGTL